MSAPAAHRCPECAAARITGHPAGPLKYDHAGSCGLGEREQSRAFADYELLSATSVPDTGPDDVAVADAGRALRAAGLELGMWEPREPTDAERALLGACGADVARLGRVVVSVVTAGLGVIRRDFLDGDGRVINVDALAPPELDPDPDPGTPDLDTTTTTEET